MARTQLVLAPTGGQQPATAPQAKSCPFGSNCSCVYGALSPARPSIEAEKSVVHSAELAAEVQRWFDRGWTVTASRTDEVVLERPASLWFCYNVALCIVTGFLWLIYWIPRSRHPKTKVVTVIAGADGSVHVARTVRDGAMRHA